MPQDWELLWGGPASGPCAQARLSQLRQQTFSEHLLCLVPLTVWVLMDENLGKRQRDRWSYGMVKYSRMVKYLMRAAVSAHSPSPSCFSHPTEAEDAGVIRGGFREEEDAGFGVADSWWP